MNSNLPVSILIVDDSPKNLLTLRSALADTGYALVEAQSGAQALKSLLDREFAVILLDVNMPGMDGFETARLIRTRPSTSKVPIIFVTSMSQENAQVFEGYSVGAVDYIFTPIVPAILKAKLSVFVELYRKSEQIRYQQELLRASERQEYEREFEIQKHNHELEKLSIREELLMGQREMEARNAELLAEKARALQKSNAELERFAFAASHDMQEPLRTVISYIQLVERTLGPRLEPNEKELFGYISSGALRMREMIRSLLDYSMQKKEVGVPASPVDCRRILEKTLASLNAIAAESSARITFDPLPVVLGHESQLNQLFQNLIGNALKFRGGKTPEVHVGVEERGDMWQFHVRDNGIGIDSTYREEVFGMFRRLNNRDEYPGSGLGLSICQKIVENHRGKIWFESEPGHGAIFFFTLPIVDEKAADLMELHDKSLSSPPLTASHH